MTACDGTPRDRAWLGRYGENVAADFLRAAGCKVLARNHRGRHRGEVDIVARHDRLLLFVEVKTRRAGARIRGFDAVDREKRRLIERGANDWLRRLGRRDFPWRFDVIEVVVTDGDRPAVRHIRDAF